MSQELAYGQTLKLRHWRIGEVLENCLGKTPGSILTSVPVFFTALLSKARVWSRKSQFLAP